LSGKVCDRTDLGNDTNGNLNLMSSGGQFVPWLKLPIKIVKYAYAKKSAPRRGRSSTINCIDDYILVLIESECNI
jgi:hypothetical protein